VNDREIVGAGIAVATAESVRSPATWLHCRVGGGVLPAGARAAVRDALERVGKALPAVQRLVQASGPGCAAHVGVRQAAGVWVAGVAGGAALGGVVDAGFAAMDARKRGLGWRPTVAATARGFGTGIVATAAGAGAATLLVGVVGPVAPIGLAMAAVAGSLAARHAVSIT